MGQQIGRGQLQGVPVVRQDLTAAGVGLVDEPLDLFVNERGHFFGVVLGLGHGTADKYFVVSRVKDHVAQPVAHAVAGDHGAGNGGGLLQVVACAGGDIAQHQLFGAPSAQTDGDAVGEVLPGLEGEVLLRQGDGHAARHAPGDDGDLMDRVLAVQRVDDQRVPGFVIGCEIAFPLNDHPAFLLRAGHHFQDRVLKIGHGDEPLFSSGGQQGRFVHQVFQVCAGETAGALGQLGKGDVLRQRLVAGVDPEDLFPALHIGRAYVHLTVKPSGAEQRRVQDVLPVGGRQDHHALVAAEAVHFHQQLVEGLLPFVVPAA